MRLTLVQLKLRISHLLRSVTSTSALVFDGGRISDYLRQAATIPVGDTVEKNGLRVHRYRGSLEVTDLANAGKRGKVVSRFTLYDIDLLGGADDAKAKIVEQNVEKLISSLADGRINFEQAKKWAFIIMEDAKTKGIHGPKVEERKLRGVDVPPAESSGRGAIKLDTPNFSLEASPLDFSVRDKKDTANYPAMMPASEAKRTSARKFYDWLTVNRDVVKSMTFNALQNALSDAGIRYHSWSTMD